MTEFDFQYCDSEHIDTGKWNYSLRCQQVVSVFELRMSMRSLMVALAVLFFSTCPGMAAPPGDPDNEAFDLENYDLKSEADWENLDILIYGDNYDYDDLDQEVREIT